MIMVAAILAWLRFACHFNLGQYLLCFVYPGLALTLIRSFAEHRAHPDPARRTAIVERAPVLGLLFLYNNLHVAHHFQPDLPWYELPALYRRERERLLAANGGLVYDGYADVFRRYLLRPHDELMHSAAMAARR
jgi:fatty acid desaturase